MFVMYLVYEGGGNPRFSACFHVRGLRRQLMTLTVTGFRIFAISFFFMGYAIFGSGFFTRSQRRRHLSDNIVFADGGLPGGGGDTSADDLGY